MRHWNLSEAVICHMLFIIQKKSKKVVWGATVQSSKKRGRSNRQCHGTSDFIVKAAHYNSVHVYNLSRCCLKNPSKYIFLKFTGKIITCNSYQCKIDSYEPKQEPHRPSMVSANKFLLIIFINLSRSKSCFGLELTLTSYLVKDVGAQKETKKD